MKATLPARGGGPRRQRPGRGRGGAYERGILYASPRANPKNQMTYSSLRGGTMQRRLLGIATALLVTITATAAAQDRKPLSPPGAASAMVGGKWSAPDKDGERKYEGGKW